MYATPGSKISCIHEQEPYRRSWSRQVLSDSCVYCFWCYVFSLNILALSVALPVTQESMQFCISLNVWNWWTSRKLGGEQKQSWGVTVAMWIVWMIVHPELTTSNYQTSIPSGESRSISTRRHCLLRLQEIPDLTPHLPIPNAKLWSHRMTGCHVWSWKIVLDVECCGKKTRKTLCSCIYSCCFKLRLQELRPSTVSLWLLCLIMFI